MRILKSCSVFRKVIIKAKKKHLFSFLETGKFHSALFSNLNILGEIYENRNTFGVIWSLHCLGEFSPIFQ